MLGYYEKEIKKATEELEKAQKKYDEDAKNLEITISRIKSARRGDRGLDARIKRREGFEAKVSLSKEKLSMCTEKLNDVRSQLTEYMKANSPAQGGTQNASGLQEQINQMKTQMQLMQAKIEKLELQNQIILSKLPSSSKDMHMEYGSQSSSQFKRGMFK